MEGTETTDKQSGDQDHVVEIPVAANVKGEIVTEGIVLNPFANIDTPSFGKKLLEIASNQYKQDKIQGLVDEIKYLMDQKDFLLDQISNYQKQLKAIAARIEKLNKGEFELTASGKIKYN